jgi:hypothetical protein
MTMITNSSSVPVEVDVEGVEVEVVEEETEVVLDIVIV